MKVGSLFSGYGGLDLAVGGDLAWYCEIEPAACKVMEAHYPGVPNIGDITKVDWSEVEPVDVITGGYPCQPFSNAGKRKGTNDERHLWPYVRDALGAIRPRYAVLENVRGHLTLGFDVVLADLADLGWSARWGVVRAADAGAPHNRARLFILASNANGMAGSQASPRSGGRSTLAQPGAQQRLERPNSGHAADANSPSRQAHDDGRQGSGDARLSQPVERGGQVATNAVSGNGQLAAGGLHAELADSNRGQRHVEWIGQVATNPSSQRHGGGQRPAGVGGMDRAHEASARQREWTRQEPGAGSVENAADSQRTRRVRAAQLQNDGADTGRGWRHDAADLGNGRSAVAWGQYAPAIDRWQHVIGRPAPAPTVRRNERDRLNPAFVEWMMGLPEGWVTGHGLSASQELKMLGNGVVPQQARLALELLGGVA